MNFPSRKQSSEYLNVNSDDEEQKNSNNIKAKPYIAPLGPFKARKRRNTITS